MKLDQKIFLCFLQLLPNRKNCAMPSLFSQIISRKIPADILYEDSQCVAFRDIHPVARVHVLIVPRKEIPRLGEASEEDIPLLGHLLLTANKVATQLGIFHSGF